jgi:UDP:flavonoid glycosyltransferase YjiC (YdhE family)
MAGDRRTIVFMPESAYGPTNNCIGIGKVLERRGHRVVFAAEASWRGKLEPLGFEEDLVDLSPPAEGDQDAGQFWIDFVAETAPEFRKPTIEQLGTFIEPVWSSLIDGAVYCHEQLQAILDRAEPDVIVEDNVNSFPALLTHGAPWVRIMSCNPLELKDPALPPTFSGYPTDDRTGWHEFGAEVERTYRDTWERFNAFVVDSGAPPLPDLEFIHESERLNLYVFPEAADYRRSHPPAPTWHRLESSVRQTEEAWDVPEELAGDGALVYLSLGSLGSADIELMRRLVAVLADTPHRYVVSKGPRADEFELPDNMWGEGPRAPNERDPALRSRDHPWRQQHDDRGAALRQADDRPAAVLGPVRQRPARSRARVRRAASDLRVRGRPAPIGGRPPGGRCRPANPDGLGRTFDPGRGRPGSRRRPHRVPRPSCHELTVRWPVGTVERPAARPRR